MPKTPSEDLELVSMRFPAVLLKKVRGEADENHMALAHEVRTAIETQYLVGLPPPMVELLEADRKELGLTRQSYFHSLLDSRYRALLAKEAAQAAGHHAGGKKK
jgi:hypothetical protein